ncbi:MAG: sulfatase-like hydrolase/transferase [Bacteroidetes bacterium]|jgi:arylsulfatase A-like enzyme|nr:sulfatase-like hydrolase/transferase [Bacteroidota bacterium]
MKIIITVLIALLGLYPFSKILAQSTEQSKPNIIIIFTDDQGYGDLSSFGSPNIRTPHLDKMATEGQKWTNFYSAASVCTPSRAGLLTGRYPVRSGMASDVTRVLFPDSKGGLPDREITIGEQVKKAGYQTAMIGKWHLGHREQYLPTNHGFDSYYGIPYSNDMDAVADKPSYWEYADEHIPIEYYNVPLMRNTEIIERPADQNTITRRYTQESISFIEENHDQPFFLFLAHSLPHIPLFASEEFTGHSDAGLYGDVIEEIDHGVGQIIKKLKELEIEEQTLVIFTSDNGPWLVFRTHGGSAGQLRAGKGMTWEGGMRVPAIFWWPGTIKTEIVTDIGSSLDIFPTVSHLVGVDLPDDRIIDGFNLTPVLMGEDVSPRNEMLFYRGATLYAARKDNFKAHFIIEGAYGQFEEKQVLETPLLFDLSEDPGEKYDVADQHPEVLAEIEDMVEKHKENLVEVKDQLAERESN